MKRLILLRHAKSSWDDSNLPDAARPLSKRGERSAPQIGQLMAREGYFPDRVLCSTAKRATQTMKCIVPAFNREIEPVVLDELYMATPREILTTIVEHGGHAGCILVIGHNPGLGDLAAWMLNDGSSKAVAKLKEKFPTAAFAVIDLPIDDWRDLDDTAIDNWSGRLIRFATPRDLESDGASKV